MPKAIGLRDLKRGLEGCGFRVFLLGMPDGWRLEA